MIDHGTTGDHFGARVARRMGVDVVLNHRQRKPSD